MAAVQGSEMFEQGYLDPANQGAKVLLETFDALQKEILEINESVKKLQKTLKLGTNIQNVKKLNKAFQESNTVRKAAIKIDTEKEKLEKKLSALRTKAASENAVLTEQIRLQRKAVRDAAKELVPLGNAYDRLVRNTDKAQKNLKRLAAEFGVNSKQAKKAKIEFDKLDDKLRGVNAAAKDGRRDVGRYGDAIKGTVGKLKTFATALGVVGGVQLLTRTIRDAFGIVKNFDAAVGNLAAISGKTAEELAPLIAQSKELGATTRFTATEVSNLQLELTKLGFLPGQIEAMAEPILNLASALGADLPTAAALTGATLNAFALQAEEAGRVTDVLVKAANSAAVDFEFFNTALSTVGPTANAVGVSLEETAALLATMANSGVDASSASTGLRNIFLTLAKTGQPLNEALDEILNSTNQAATAFDLFGKRGASLGVILANNQEATSGLNETLLEAGGTAKEVADKQLDTLQGSLDLLRSAWEGYILGASEAGGISDKLKNIVKFLADNLDKILNVILALVKGFIIYKSTILIATIATKAYSAAQKAAATGAKVFSTALKSIPFAQVFAIAATIVPLIFDLADAFFNSSKAAEEFSAAEEVLNEVTEETNKRLIEEQAELGAVFEALKLTKQGTEERQEALDEVNERYGLTLQNLQDEAEFVTQIDDAYKSLIATLKEKIRTEVIKDKLTALLQEQVRLEITLSDLRAKEAEERKRLGKEGVPTRTIDPVTGAITFGVELPDLTQAESSVAGFIDVTEILLAQAQEKIEALTKSSADALDDIFGEDADSAKTAGDKAKKQQDTRNAEIQDLQKQHQLELIKIENEGIAAGLDRELIQAQIFERRRLQLIEELNLTKKLFGEGSKEALEAQITLQNEFLKLAEQQNIDILDLKKEGNEELLKEEKTFAQVQAEIAKKVRDAIGKKEKEDQAKRIKLFKETTKQLIEISRTLTDAREQEIDQRIDKERQEIETSESRIDSLEEAARQGNITAQESIKAEAERIAASEREISELEKKKANLLAFTVALKLLEQAIDSGDNNAIVNAGAKLVEFIGNIPKFIEGTGAGTIAEAVGAPNLKGEDGYIIRADGKEKILNPKQAAMTGSLSADEIAYGAMRWHSDKKMIGSVVKRKNAVETRDAQIDELITAVKDKHIPVSTTDVDTIKKIATTTVKYENKLERTHTRTDGAFS